jgi:tetratricopeptide (TPR) repeat protein
MFPDYHYALANLARIRMAQKRYDEAASLFQKRYANAQHAENLFDVAEALHHAGKTAEATAAFAKFEKAALAESETHDNSNRELIAYYLDYAHQPEKALAIAKHEIAWRQDVHTLDAYARALHASGQAGEAKQQIAKALGVGVKDPVILAHAEQIAAAQ